MKTVSLARPYCYLHSRREEEEEKEEEQEAGANGQAWEIFADKIFMDFVALKNEYILHLGFKYNFRLS